jgi:metal-dependent amidase/aminoacylase/carboxypeptidase family protein
LPVYADAEARVKANLRTIAAGGRAALVAIGAFTEQQWAAINAVRHDLGLHALEGREIVFIGRHLHASRAKDGYTVDDMWARIAAACSEVSEVHVNPRMTELRNPEGRADGYGNIVHDRAVFECTQRKPRAELFSVIPKGDTRKPITERPTAGVSLSEDDPG